MVWVIVGLAAIWLAFRILTIGCCRFERLSCRPLRAVASDHPKAQDAASARVVAAATSMGYRVAGTYSDGDKGVLEGILTLLVSADERTILCIHHGRAVRRHRLMSRRENGTWLVTSSILGGRDLSGLIDEKMLPTEDFAVLHGYHLDRLGVPGSTPGSGLLAIAPELAAAELDGLKIRVVRKLIETGLARPVGDFDTVFQADPAACRMAGAAEFRWRYTTRGAFKLGAWPSIGNTKRQMDLAKALEKEWKRANLSAGPTATGAAPPTRAPHA